MWKDTEKIWSILCGIDVSSGTLSTDAECRKWRENDIYNIHAHLQNYDVVNIVMAKIETQNICIIDLYGRAENSILNTLECKAVG